MRKVLAAIAVLGLAAQAQAVNLITNGDFSAGNSGFTSDYTYQPSTGNSGGAGNALEGEGMYAVGTNAANYHGSWASYGDKTTGSGNYMIVNGASDVTKNVWQSNVITLGAGVYTFSAWLSDACCNNSFQGTNFPPVLAFIDTVGGVTVGPTMAFTIPTTNPGTWYQVSSSFTVLAGTSGTVILRNSQNAASGNDFGLDDIVLEQTGTVPEPLTWAMMVGGFGLMGATMRRRRVSTTFA